MKVTVVSDRCRLGEPGQAIEIAADDGINVDALIAAGHVKKGAGKASSNPKPEEG